jgi:hypothetical protein
MIVYSPCGEPGCSVISPGPGRRLDGRVLLWTMPAQALRSLAHPDASSAAQARSEPVGLVRLGHARERLPPELETFSVSHERKQPRPSVQAKSR